MAFVKLQNRDYVTSFSVENAESDYGSDLDQDAEQILDGVLSLIEAAALKPLVLESIDEDAPLSDPRTAIVPKVAENNCTLEVDLGRRILSRTALETPVEIEYDEPSRTAFRVAQDGRLELERGKSVEPEVEGRPEDTRSPIQRFRTAPRKPLSVTDLSSPAWCELQYWFTLLKFGRKRATPAMKQGTKLHKALEDEVYTAVPITTTTKEDIYGLKIWNVIQGLRTLRVTGMTRELEIWGLIDGEVVNGVIDEVSYSCPDEEARESLLKVTETSNDAKPLLDSDQTTLEQFFNSSSDGSLESSSAWPGKPSDQGALPRIYIQDVKTTKKRTLPSGPAIRPTEIQLMLYHFLLTSLISNPLPAVKFCSRYRVDGNAPFSQSFLSQLSNVDFNFLPEASSQTSRTDQLFGNSNNVATELTEHGNLNTLWGLMLQEYKRTFPVTTATDSKPETPTLSTMLTASYRLSSDGTFLGNRTFIYEQDAFETYIKDEMAWWQGEREARGVEIEEAFKCGFCEFADGCQWREQKVEEGIRKARLRKEKRKKSDV